MHILKLMGQALFLILFLVVLYIWTILLLSHQQQVLIERSSTSCSSCKPSTVVLVRTPQDTVTVF